MTGEMDRAKLSAAAWKIIANQRIGSVPVASGNILANDGPEIGFYVFSMLHLLTPRFRRQQFRFARKKD
ncbi:hypothetical protein TNCT_87001 [Trichonephila clavata]|uniref:Uncharacterized protein n=1 Tax=Trichonephila clavata TaxID=2740835 RepID=A0A8X6GRY8_TRICU|nr:hypothetical protein TNCT_87001 [Trichonephila clavata]